MADRLAREARAPGKQQWYQGPVRQLMVCLMTALWLAACAAQPNPAPPSSSPRATPSAGPVNPVNIKRIRSALPAGYEIADVAGPLKRSGVWGFGPGGPQAPAMRRTGRPGPRRSGRPGYSASGPGGTMYVVVAAPGQGVPDAGLIGDCGNGR